MDLEKQDLVMQFGNNNTPFVAIWMVTYNHENYLSEAVESVMIQETNFEYKLFIGEDCSTDNTRKICKKLKEKYPKKIELFLNEKNLGGNLNARQIYKQCFESGAKYVALLEGDDYWTDPLKLQIQVDFLEEHSDYTGCFHYTQTVKENGELGSMACQNNNIMDFDAEDTFSTLALFHTSSFVFLRSALELPVWLSKIVSGDMALFSIIAAKGQLRCLPEEMSIYRKHEGGITSAPNILNNFHSQRIELMECLNEFHNYKYQKAADAVIEYHRMALNTNIKKIGLFYKIIQKAKK
jgi:glycosyltransferase involved in cell wall biosynthesis